MRLLILPACGVLAFVLASHPASGQNLLAANNDSSASSAESSQSSTTPAATVKHLSYSAEFKQTNQQILADGTMITEERTSFEAQDAEGRRLSSENMRPDFTITYVRYPDGKSLSWSTTQKTVTKNNMPSRDQRHGCWADSQGRTHHWGAESNVRKESASSSTNPAQPAPSNTGQPATSKTTKELPSNFSYEDLGTDSFLGIKVNGYRITHTTPVGAIGNDRPIVEIDEDWFAPDLGTILRSIHEDPRTGKKTNEATSVTLGEPDPSLFQPPDDYIVKTVDYHQVPCN